MKLEINERNKTAMIWLTGAEQADPIARELLGQRTAAYRQQKYTVAIFCSGKNDLQSTTERLLLYNQKVSAHRDLERAGNHA